MASYRLWLILMVYYLSRCIQKSWLKQRSRSATAASRWMMHRLSSPWALATKQAKKFMQSSRQIAAITWVASILRVMPNQIQAFRALLAAIVLNVYCVPHALAYSMVYARLETRYR